MTKFVADFKCPKCQGKIVYDDEARTLTCKCTVSQGVRYVNKTHFAVLKQDSALMVMEAKQ